MIVCQTALLHPRGSVVSMRREERRSRLSMRLEDQRCGIHDQTGSQTSDREGRVDREHLATRTNRMRIFENP